MPLKPIFIIIILILFLNINSKLQIKFQKYNSLLSELLERNITFFVDYFIENTYSTQLYLLKNNWVFKAGTINILFIK